MVNNARKQGFSLLIVRLAIAAVSISILVMLLAVAISKGYQKEVRGKLIGFNTHFQINNLDLNNSYNSMPIVQDTIFENNLRLLPEVAHIQPYITKAGIIKTDDEFEGIVLKGINNDYDFSFLQKHLVKGSKPNFTDDSIANFIVLSQKTADKLGFKLNDDVIIYFIQEPPRVRKLKITGIFNTGLGEVDALYAFTDLRILQRLHGYNHNQITGYEVILKPDFKTSDVKSNIKLMAPYDYDVKPIEKIFPQMVEWLDLLDLNVLVVIILMILVASINMITALLILIVERSNMIGILKALGSNNKQIQQIFLYMAANIIIKGLIIGNTIGLLLILFQQKTNFFKLNADDYYLDVIPVNIGLNQILIINILAFVLCLFTLLLPVRVISKISPVKAIRFT
ncbi:MAG: ABC transporter permease [Bacteroidia bacterium]